MGYFKLYESNSPDYKPIEISTEAEMSSVLKLDNIGKTYKFTGTSDIYVTGDLYQIETEYLNFTANIENCAIAMAHHTYENTEDTNIDPVLYYSTDKETWTQFIIGTTTVTLPNIGDTVYFKGDNQTFSSGYSNYYYFIMSGSISANGNIMSIIDSTMQSLTIPSDYFFYYLFDECTSLTSPPLLPATTLTECCYGNIFSGCISLTQAPILPATTLANWCYRDMFYNCTSLIIPPELPALILQNYCYYYMFSGCTSLLSTPKLNSMHLAENCYSGMFQNCTALTIAPELPATTLSSYCYSYMFSGCTSLIQSPELHSTTLANYCYSNMFYGCTSLTQTPILPATTFALGCYNGIVGGTNLFPDLTNIDLKSTAHAISGVFNGIFSGTKITDAMLRELLPINPVTNHYYLPAMILTDSCYAYMFADCTLLQTAPELHATTLANWCYGSMFSGCTSLTTAPELPVTTLFDTCYYEMFGNCTSLTTIPTLPATILPEWCYAYMFRGCTSLYVSDSSISGTAEQAWTIPSNAVCTSQGDYATYYMFTRCLGTRSTNTPQFAGTQKTYYTQNVPV